MGFRVFAPLALVVIWAAKPDIPPLTAPLAGLKKEQIRDTFSEIHSGHPHEAIDIMAPMGTPVLAVAPGSIRKLFFSQQGGNTIYEFDETRALCFYYAHLDRYAPGLREGMHVNAAQEIGFVGSTGNARADAPHLHFAITTLDDPNKWWKGRYLNPYSALIDSIRH
jgi:murein DD-endopeptidase MepM/ murein hydrolase activator NlpD